MLLSGKLKDRRKKVGHMKGKKENKERKERREKGKCVLE